MSNSSEDLFAFSREMLSNLLIALSIGAIFRFLSPFLESGCWLCGALLREICFEVTGVVKVSF